MQSEKHVEKEKKGFPSGSQIRNAGRKKSGFLRMQIRKDMYKDFHIANQSP
jgi:hypothetical protein